MIRTKEQVLNELQHGEDKDSDIVQTLLTIINNSQTIETYKASLLNIVTTDGTKLIMQIPCPDLENYKKWISEGRMKEEQAKSNLSKFYGSKIRYYFCIIADLLSVFRDNVKCMQVAESAYLLWTIDNSGDNVGLSGDIMANYLNAQECLAELYSDEKCTIHNYSKAYVAFKMAYLKYSNMGKEKNVFYKNNETVFWSEDANMVYAYAKTILQNVDNYFIQKESFINLKWARDLGHLKAKEEHTKECKSKGCCTYCHHLKFKGLFTKTCANCGKKREY
ncbi:MAG: hypothetical protein J6C97_05935 [Clostridia bacterium]|nr:hypothetical protein [Clostridia bacterium]